MLSYTKFDSWLKNLITILNNLLIPKMSPISNITQAVSSVMRSFGIHEQHQVLVPEETRQDIPNVIERVQNIAVSHGYELGIQRPADGRWQNLRINGCDVPLIIEFDENDENKKQSGMITTWKESDCIVRNCGNLERAEMYKEVISNLGWCLFGKSPTRKCIDTSNMSDQQLSNMFRYFYSIFV